MIRRFGPALAILFAPVLAACVPHVEVLPMPRGYVHLDNTPLSSPNGYKLDPVRDARVKEQRAENAADWQAAASDLVQRLAPMLSQRPSEIAVAPLKAFTPTSGAFDFALREALTNQGFIVSTSMRSPTILKYEARQTEIARMKDGAFLDLTLRLNDGTRDFAGIEGTYKIRHQDLEIAKLPGFSAQPAPGLEKLGRAPVNR